MEKYLYYKNTLHDRSELIYSRLHTLTPFTISGNNLTDIDLEEWVSIEMGVDDV